MKKWSLMVVMGCLMAVVLTSQADVTSINVAAVYSVTVPGNGGFNMVALNIDDFEGQTVADVIGDQARADVVKPNADLVLIYKPTPTPHYVRVGRNASKGGAWYDYDNWTTTPTNPVLEAGMSFWVKTGNNKGDLTLTFTGEAVDAASVETTLTAGFNQFAYPFSCDIDANATSLTNGYPNMVKPNTDQILVWDDSLGDYLKYGLHPTREWRSLTGWPNSPALAPLPMGAGIWYKRNTGQGDFVWVEANQYINNL